MPRRNSIPLHKKRMAKFIEAAHSHDNPHKQMISLLGLGTGARNYTLGHIHEDWFFYDTGDDALYLQIPARDECQKDPDSDKPCGDCRDYDHDQFEPKTPAAGNRIILISNNYTNHNEGDRLGAEQYFGLRDLVESYFSLSDPNAPDTAQHGNRMIGPQANGISRNTVNSWIRDIAAESGIKAPMRAARIRKEITDDDDDDNNDEYEDPVKQWGKDEAGNTIPDLTAHDLRASFCTQLMRNEVPPNKAINKTGHKDPDNLKPYIMFAANEIDAGEEEGFF